MNEEEIGKEIEEELKTWSPQKYSGNRVVKSVDTKIITKWIAELMDRSSEQVSPVDKSRKRIND